MSDYQKPIRPVITGIPGTPVTRKPVAVPGQGASFGDMLKARLDQQPAVLTLSKHAQVRAVQRGIQLSDADMQRLQGAMEKAQDKGIKDTLVMMDSNAFIINVPNRVIVTMVDGSDKEVVFTNIDGAVIV